MPLADEEASFLGLGALVGDPEEFHRSEEFILMDPELLMHPLIGGTGGEGVDDLLVGDVGDTAADLAEALNVLTESFARVLLDGLEIPLGRGTVVRRLEIGLELVAEVFPGGNRLLGEVHQPRAGVVLEGHGKPIGHDAMVPMRGQYGHGVELQELERVGGAVVARREVGLELVRPGDVAHVASEVEAPSVVCPFSRDVDVAARLGDTDDGIVLALAAPLDGDARVFRGAHDFLAA